MALSSASTTVAASALPAGGDGNGLLLAELLDLADALGVGVVRQAPPLPPRFADLARDR